jgi:hypothetical protein
MKYQIGVDKSKKMPDIVKTKKSIFFSPIRSSTVSSQFGLHESMLLVQLIVVQ